MTQSHATGAPPHRQRMSRDDRRVVAGTMVGTTIEWYDFFIFAQAAGIVFANLYFKPLDTDSPGLAQLVSWATIGVSFFFRPLGAVIAGRLGDRVGRKAMLVFTLVMMGASTALIGLLPTYAQIGVWAPILLMVLRILQGFSAGGEWGGAALMAVEHAPGEQARVLGRLSADRRPGGDDPGDAGAVSAQALHVPGAIPGMGLEDTVPAVRRPHRAGLLHPGRRVGKPGLQGDGGAQARVGHAAHAAAADEQAAGDPRRGHLHRQQRRRIPRDRLPVLLRPEDPEDGSIPGAAGHAARLLRVARIHPVRRRPLGQDRQGQDLPDRLPARYSPG